MKSLTTFLLFLVATTAFAQSNTRVYLDPDHTGFSGYFSSALEKKNVPVTVTTDRNLADYVVKFRANNSDGSMVQGILSALNSRGTDYNSGAFNEVTINVIDQHTQDVVFSYTCKKYDKYSSQDNSRASSVAECLAKHWKNKLDKK